jgi:hypothetical protein
MLPCAMLQLFQATALSLFWFMPPQEALAWQLVK